MAGEEKMKKIPEQNAQIRKDYDFCSAAKVKRRNKKFQVSILSLENKGQTDFSFIFPSPLLSITTTAHAYAPIMCAVHPQTFFSLFHPARRVNFIYSNFFFHACFPSLFVLAKQLNFHRSFSDECSQIGYL